MKALLKFRVLVARLWSAVTCHRFVGLADLSARQRRTERRGELPRPVVRAESVRHGPSDGDKSPAESADKSAHSKAPGARLVGFREKFAANVLDLSAVLAAWLAPHPPWRRYRVAPRANPAAFRDIVLRGIQLELHRAGLVSSRRVPGRTTL